MNSFAVSNNAINNSTIDIDNDSYTIITITKTTDFSSIVKELQSIFARFSEQTISTPFCMEYFPPTTQLVYVIDVASSELLTCKYKRQLIHSLQYTDAAMVFVPNIVNKATTMIPSAISVHLFNTEYIHYNKNIFETTYTKGKDDVFIYKYALSANSFRQIVRKAQKFLFLYYKLLSDIELKQNTSATERSQQYIRGCVQYAIHVHENIRKLCANDNCAKIEQMSAAMFGYVMTLATGYNGFRFFDENDGWCGHVARYEPEWYVFDKELLKEPPMGYCNSELIKLYFEARHFINCGVSLDDELYKNENVNFDVNSWNDVSFDFINFDNERVKYELHCNRFAKCRTYFTFNKDYEFVDPNDVGYQITPTKTFIATMIMMEKIQNSCSDVYVGMLYIMDELNVDGEYIEMREEVRTNGKVFEERLAAQRAIDSIYVPEDSVFVDNVVYMIDMKKKDDESDDEKCRVELFMHKCVEDEQVVDDFRMGLRADDNDYWKNMNRYESSECESNDIW